MDGGREVLPEVSSGQLAVGNWQLAIGSWQLAIGSWQLAVGNGQFKAQRRSRTLQSRKAGWQLTFKSLCPLQSADCRL